MSSQEAVVKRSSPCFVISICGKLHRVNGNGKCKMHLVLFLYLHTNAKVEFTEEFVSHTFLGLVLLSDFLNDVSYIFGEGASDKCRPRW